MSKPTDLVQGTLDLLLLKIVALEPLHGWAIAQRLKQSSGDVLQVSEGSLYPALHKLQRRKIGPDTDSWRGFASRGPAHATRNDRAADVARGSSRSFTATAASACT